MPVTFSEVLKDFQSRPLAERAKIGSIGAAVVATPIIAVASTIGAAVMGAKHHHDKVELHRKDQQIASLQRQLGGDMTQAPSSAYGSGGYAGAPLSY